jgi:S-adenosylmethionine/arginine decarboxylase-like enzyme
MLVHKHLIVRAEVDHAPTERSWIERWLKQLVEKIGMKVCAGPISQYLDMPGNRGMTAVVIIETSHIALHCWDEPTPNLLQFDVYSCGEFDVEEILRELNQFGLLKVEYKFLDREHGLTEIAV